MTKTELFLKLAAPDKNGVSRWVYVSEFVGEYADLTFGNGASWARKESTLAKKYNVESILNALISCENVYYIDCETDLKDRIQIGRASCRERV